MNGQYLSNVLARLAPNQGFAIYDGDVENQADYNTKVVFNNPEQKPAWSAVEAGKTDEQWVIVRAQRDGKLVVCDWTQLADVPLTEAQKTAWQTYRTALRDITTQSDPFNINWPSPPE